MKIGICRSVDLEKCNTSTFDCTIWMPHRRSAAQRRRHGDDADQGCDPIDQVICEILCGKMVGFPLFFLTKRTR